MIDEKRTETVTVRFPASLKEAIEKDRQSKGQTLVVWLERAALDRLRGVEITE